MNHQVRNCKDFEDNRFRPGYTSPKIDGVRAFYYPGQERLISRQGKILRGLKHIVEAIGNFPYPLDMELTVPGLEFNELSGIIRSFDQTPAVKAHIIDVPIEGDLVNRLKTRGPLITYNNNLILQSIPHYWCQYLSDFKDHHLTFLELGYEGSVWKSKNHQYENKRNWHWMRLVPVGSEDCKILGVYEGKGKMEGIAGGIWIDFNGIECKCGVLKGMDYEARRLLLENEDEYIGVIAEIQYKNLQPSGKPRQPRMKGFRYDKTPEDR